MGTTSSSPNNTIKQQKKPHIQHERFTQCEIKPQQSQITTRVKVDFTMFDYQYWQKNLNLLKQDPTSDMLLLPKSYQLQKPTITCGTGDNLKLTFDNFPFILQQQIRNRSINCPPNYLDQEELWMLLYTLVKSQHAFANLSLKVGDIHPHNIFINSQGYPRLACQFSWPNQKSNFQKMYYDKIPRYLSPQEMKLCQQGSHPDLCYSNTSQAFSIGLTMLGVGILQNLDRIYDTKTFKFNTKYLQNSITKWMTLKFRHPQTGQIVSYSDQIKDIIRGLCNEDINKRYLVSKIYEILKKYEKKIINVQRFKIDGYEQLMGLKQNERKDYLSNKIIISPRIVPQQLPNLVNNQPIIKVNPNNSNQQQLHYKSIFHHYSTINSNKKPLKNQLQDIKKIETFQSEKYQKGNITVIKQSLKIKQLDQSILQPKRNKNQYTGYEQYQQKQHQQSIFNPQFITKNVKQQQYQTLYNLGYQKKYQQKLQINPISFQQRRINFTTSAYIPSIGVSTNQNDIIKNIQLKIKQSQQMFQQKYQN